jgi:hypothetical protein
MKARQFTLLCVAAGLASALSNRGFASQALQEKLKNPNVFVADDSPDYACTKTKKCKLGCCGPL